MCKQHADYLELIRRVLEQLRQILARYTVLAASVDESYQKNSPLSPRFDASRLKSMLVIDDVSIAAEARDSICGQDGRIDGKHEHGTAAETKKKKHASRYSFFGKAAKKPPLKRASSTTSFQLHPGVAWWFKKDQLAETLAEFTDWNKRLEHLVGPLMSGFGFYDNKALQKRLQPDGKENIFKSLLEVSKLSDTLDGGAETSKGKGPRHSVEIGLCGLPVRFGLLTRLGHSAAVG